MLVRVVEVLRLPHLEVRDRPHLELAGKVRLLVELPLEGEHRKVTLRVAVVVDFNRRTGNACMVREMDEKNAPARGKWKCEYVRTIRAICFGGWLFVCVCVLQWQLHATILTVVRSVVDDGLYDLGTVAGHVPDHVARQRPVLLLLLQQLVQGPGVQLHRIVQIGGIDRHVLMGICETQECKGTKQSDG